MPRPCAHLRHTRFELEQSLQASKLVWVYIAIVVLVSLALVAAVYFGVRWHRRNVAMHVMLAKHAERWVQGAWRVVRGGGHGVG